MFSAASKSVSSGGYQIGNSLRFRSSASAYLNRTPSVAGNRTTWTWSAWVKRGILGANKTLFGAGSASNQIFFLAFGTDDKLYVHNGLQGTSTESWGVTSQVFRDPSSWYHLVLVMDTTNATAANRVKLYVNGVQSTLNNNSTNYYPSQNYATAINNTVSTTIGFGFDNVSTSYTDGYLAEVNFIDGQALTPSSFGSINATTGVWQPARYTGSYGTNGFYLKFNNGTSTTTLGNDSSGNGNNWTTNNISLTAGSTYDWMIDSPTSYAGSSYGVGNYCVMNPLKNYGGTISNANQTVVFPAGEIFYQTQNTIAMSSGAWYWEVYLSSVLSGVFIGILTTSSSGRESFTSANFWGYYTAYGNKWHTSSSPYGSASTTGDTIGVAFDATNGTLTFYKNGVSQGVAFTGLTGLTVNASIHHDSHSAVGSTTIHNFGQRPFNYTPPAGFKSLCTQNLPAPAIYNGANHMAATLWTGNGGSSVSISNANNGVGFQPDFVWVKERDIAQNNTLMDSVRGPGYMLFTDTTNAEYTATTYGQLTSFNSNGFTASKGSDSIYSYFNRNTGTYVGWQWKAGGTAVTNTAGTITSQVSANPTAGFSVVTYTGNGTNPGATIGHGLGVTPSMIITKARSTTGEWPSYHVSIGVTNTLYPNATYAASTYVNRFSAVSSTTFTTGSSGSELNTNGTTYVAYCFAAIPGYSAFGSYTGNGSTDGPFVYCGFRPRFVLVKGTAVSSWYLWDSSRASYNVINETLYPNLSNAEGGSGGIIDFLSNGFKIRTTGTDLNANGNTMIFAAFAENPFQNSLAR